MNKIKILSKTFGSLTMIPENTCFKCVTKSEHTYDVYHPGYYLAGTILCNNCSTEEDRRLLELLWIIESRKIPFYVICNMSELKIDNDIYTLKYNLKRMSIQSFFAYLQRNNKEIKYKIERSNGNEDYFYANCPNHRENPMYNNISDDMLLINMISYPMTKGFPLIRLIELNPFLIDIFMKCKIKIEIPDMDNEFIDEIKKYRDKFKDFLINKFIDRFSFPSLPYELTYKIYEKVIE